MRSANTFWIEFQDMLAAYIIRVGLSMSPWVVLSTVVMMSSFDLLSLARACASMGFGNISVVMFHTLYWFVADSTLHSLMYWALLVVTLTLTVVPMSSCWMLSGSFR